MAVFRLIQLPQKRVGVLKNPSNFAMNFCFFQTTMLQTTSNLDQFFQETGPFQQRNSAKPLPGPVILVSQRIGRPIILKPLVFSLKQQLKTGVIPQVNLGEAK